MPANSFSGVRLVNVLVSAQASYAFDRTQSFANVAAVPVIPGTTLLLPPKPTEGEWYGFVNGDNSAGAGAPITLEAQGAATFGGGVTSLTFGEPGCWALAMFFEKLDEWAVFSSAIGGSSVIPNPSWLQANWYIDWVNGKDSNPGTLALPVKTVMGGVVAKWGTTAPILMQTTALHILTSQPIGAEKIVLRPVLVFD